MGVKGYGGGVIGRYSDLPEEFPAVAEFHTLRVNMPSGLVLHHRQTAPAVRRVGQARHRSDQHARRYRRYHPAGRPNGAPAALLSTIWPRSASTWAARAATCARPAAASGPAAASMPASIPWICCTTSRWSIQNELHRPMFPYKSKIKISGCPNDCVAAVPRSDIAIIGTWRDKIQVDQAEVANTPTAGWISRRSRSSVPDQMHAVGRREQER